MLPSPEKSNVARAQPEDQGSQPVSDTQPIIEQGLATGGLGKMLDVGCGTGLLVRRLLEHGVDAYGVDTDAARIAEADRWVGSHYQVASALRLPYEPESFDTIISIDYLERLDEVDIPPALSELYQIGRES